MEGQSVRSSVVMLMIVGVLMGMFVGQTSASFRQCYNICMIKCDLTHPGRGLLICPPKCLARCARKESPSTDDSLHTYCKIGCASSECINISTPQDPRVEEVEGCVYSCSNKCTKQFQLVV